MNVKPFEDWNELYVLFRERWQRQQSEEGGDGEGGRGRLKEKSATIKKLGLALPVLPVLQVTFLTLLLPHANLILVTTRVRPRARDSGD